MFRESISKDIFSFFTFTFHKNKLLREAIFLSEKNIKKAIIKGGKQTKGKDDSRSKEIESIVSNALPEASDLTKAIELERWQKKLRNPLFRLKPSKEISRQICAVEATAEGC